MKRLSFFLIVTALLMYMIACFARAEENVPGIARFETVDLKGEPFDPSYFQGNEAKLILLNLWEPWCQPCVGEMPELEKLYENYKEKGLVILGVFRDNDVDFAQKVIAEYGITYPIVRYTADFEEYSSPYVPTSAFLAPDGTVYEDQIIGARDYAKWEILVNTYLK